MIPQFPWKTTHSQATSFKRQYIYPQPEGWVLIGGSDPYPTFVQWLSTHWSCDPIRAVHTETVALSRGACPWECAGWCCCGRLAVTWRPEMRPPSGGMQSPPGRWVENGSRWCQWRPNRTIPKESPVLDLSKPMSSLMVKASLGRVIFFIFHMGESYLRKDLLPLLYAMGCHILGG